MKKRALIGIGSLLVLLVAVMLCVLLQSIQEDYLFKKTEAYKEFSTHQYNIGQIAYLYSEDDDEGRAFGWCAGFDWRGMMAVSVGDVTLYRDLTNANNFEELVGEKGMNLISDYSEPLVFVEVDLLIKNIDALPLGDELSFNASLFSLTDSVTAGDIPFVDLGEAAFVNPSEKNAYKYFLNPGEEATIKIGWFVDASEINDGLVLVIGASGNQKYYFNIGKNEIKETPMSWAA